MELSSQYDSTVVNYNCRVLYNIGHSVTRLGYFRKAFVKNVFSLVVQIFCTFWLFYKMSLLCKKTAVATSEASFGKTWTFLFVLSGHTAGDINCGPQCLQTLTSDSSMKVSNINNTFDDSQEVTSTKERFNFTLPKKSWMNGRAIKGQRILVSCLPCIPNEDLGCPTIITCIHYLIGFAL